MHTNVRTIRYVKMRHTISHTIRCPKNLIKLNYGAISCSDLILSSLAFPIRSLFGMSPILRRVHGEENEEYLLREDILLRQQGLTGVKKEKKSRPTRANGDLPSIVEALQEEE